MGGILALEEQRIPISGIAGVSSSFIGGLYASGVYIQTLIDQIKTVKWRSFASFHLSKHGMVSSRNIEKLVDSFVGNQYISECKIPFAALCTNIMNGKFCIFIIKILN